MQTTKAMAALAAITMILAAWPALSAAADRPAYRKYVACAKVVDAKPSRHCTKADDKGAFFRSNLRSVNYSVCVVFPTGKSLCAKRQRAKMGELYVNEITSKMLGWHRVNWFVKGKKVGTYRFRITDDAGKSKGKKSPSKKKKYR